MKSRKLYRIDKKNPTVLLKTTESQNTEMNLGHKHHILYTARKQIVTLKEVHSSEFCRYRKKGELLAIDIRLHHRREVLISMVTTI